MLLPDDHIWLIPPREEEQEEFLSYLFARVTEQIEPYMARCQLDFLRSLPDHLSRRIEKGLQEADGDLYIPPYEVNAYASQTCGDNLYWNVENDVLYIFGFGDMWDYASPMESGPRPPWAEKSFSKISIGYGVTSIGRYAFHYLSLSTVEIPPTLEHIGTCAFFSTGIEVLHLPGTLHSIGSDIISADPCMVSKLILSCDIENIASEAFYTRLRAPEEIVLTGRRPESASKLVSSHLFRFIAQRILYPQSWDTEEQSFFDMLREEIEDVSEYCDELRYRDKDYEDLKESLIPYSGDAE